MRHFLYGAPVNCGLHPVVKLLHPPVCVYRQSTSHTPGIMPLCIPPPLQAQLIIAGLPGHGQIIIGSVEPDPCIIGGRPLCIVLCIPPAALHESCMRTGHSLTVTANELHPCARNWLQQLALAARVTLSLAGATCCCSG